MSAIGPHPGPTVAGRLRLLACPAALCPHAEFAVAAVLGAPVSLRWTPQTQLPGQLQAGLDYQAQAGTGGQLAARLRRLAPLRFEVTEQGCAAADAERYSFDPALGLHRATLSAAGEVVLTQGQLSAALEQSRCSGATAEALTHAISRLLGEPWDAALDLLRLEGDGAPVSWLSQAG